MSFYTEEILTSASLPIEQKKEELIPFKISDLKPNHKTYLGRVFHFLNTTNPMNLLVSDSQILHYYKIIKHYERLEKNNEFANIARNLGAIIPQLRPLELAYDPYGVKEVLLDFLETNSFTSEFENVLVISPTCPLLNSEDIEKAYFKFKERNAKILLSITETDHNSYRSLIVENDYIVPLFEKDIHKKTQELKTTYRINGAIIILKLQ